MRFRGRISGTRKSCKHESNNFELRRLLDPHKFFRKLQIVSIFSNTLELEGSTHITIKKSLNFPHIFLFKIQKRHEILRNIRGLWYPNYLEKINSTPLWKFQLEKKSLNSFNILKAKSEFKIYTFWNFSCAMNRNISISIFSWRQYRWMKFSLSFDIKIGVLQGFYTFI